MTRALLLGLLAAGRVEGTIAYSGRPVRAQRAPSADAGCARPTTPPPVVLSKSGAALANVVVRVIDGPAVEPPAAPVLIALRGCAFEPRVSVAVPGQALRVKNEDGTLHDVHAATGLWPDAGTTLFRVVQPAGAPPLERTLRVDGARAADGAVRLECEVHPFMRAYVLLSPSGRFSVSDAEGRWRLELPTGKHTLEAWHETLGTRVAEVTVTEGKTVEVPFGFR